MDSSAKHAIVVIPSLEPDERLPVYVEDLLGRGIARIVVVDDGSSGEYQPIFARIAAVPNCTVLHHAQNRGKGAALKTAYAYIHENMPDCLGVVTADADGQHTAQDVLRLEACLREGGKRLILGSRDFSLGHVPKKSRMGNRITSTVFFLLYGRRCADTQTGLRAFPESLLEFMTGVSGDRFEYEMNVLIACAREKIPFISVQIETVYENENKGTHFHPLRDSWRIYKVIFGNFFRFICTSLGSFLIDQAFFWLMMDIVLKNAALSEEAAIWVGGFSARIVSAVCNYLMNRYLVFRPKDDTGRSAWRYAVLCVAIICLSNAGVTLLNLIGLNEKIGKVICDTLLYFVSYQVQHRWVFTKRTDAKRQ